MNIKTKIISAFPGTGKSWMYKNQHLYGLNILDSDSSAFDKSEFPQNYIKHIQDNIGKVDIIFVSSHKAVRDALIENNIHFIAIFPHISLCSEYCQRYIDRGSSGDFIKLLIENWNHWLTEYDNLQVTKNELMSGMYISDIFKQIEI